jgi:hypothetical protein
MSKLLHQTHQHVPRYLSLRHHANPVERQEIPVARISTKSKDHPRTIESAILVVVPPIVTATTIRVQTAPIVLEVELAYPMQVHDPANLWRVGAAHVLIDRYVQRDRADQMLVSQR